MPETGPWVLHFLASRGERSEYVVGPFGTAEEASDWLSEHRRDDWFGGTIFALYGPDEFFEMIELDDA